MSTTWSNELELTLLECYQAEPILWESNHKDHKNKNKVHDAWTRISAILNIPVADCKKKKDSLMSSYRTYRKKVKDSIHSGASSSDIYKPIWFAYELMDSFLGEGGQCKQTINTERPPSEINEVEESLDAPVDDSQSTRANEDDSPSMRPPTIRRRNKPSMEIMAAGETVKDALVTLKDIDIKSRKTQDDDECDLHGKVIAKKLRKIPENERTQFICEIYNLFIRHEQRTSLYVASPTPSPSYTNHHYQRPHSSQSSYSEPPMHYYVPPPEIHIPETPASTASQVIITSNRNIQTGTEEYTNNIQNLIDMAYKNA